MAEVLGGELLTEYTKTMLEVAHIASAGLPPDYSIKVSASSDVVISHEPSGEWLGVEMKGMDPERRSWHPWRGSVLMPDTAKYATLDEVIDKVIEMVECIHG